MADAGPPRCRRLMQTAVGLQAYSGMHIGPDVDRTTTLGPCLAAVSGLRHRFGTSRVSANLPLVSCE